MCYNGFTIKINLCKSKRFKDGRCTCKRGSFFGNLTVPCVPKDFFPYCVPSNNYYPPLTHPVHVYSGTKKMVAENLYVI